MTIVGFSSTSLSNRHSKGISGPKNGVGSSSIQTDADEPPEDSGGVSRNDEAVEIRGKSRRGRFEEDGRQPRSVVVEAEVCEISFSIFGSTTEQVRSVDDDNDDDDDKDNDDKDDDAAAPADEISVDPFVEKTLCCRFFFLEKKVVAGLALKKIGSSPTSASTKRRFSETSLKSFVVAKEESVVKEASVAR